MKADLKAIITRAQSDIPNHGIVVCDCDKSDVFYVPTSQLNTFLQNDCLSSDDLTQIEAVRQEHVNRNDVTVLTFQHQKLITITTFDDENNFECVCPISNPEASE